MNLLTAEQSAKEKKELSLEEQFIEINDLFKKLREDRYYLERQWEVNYLSVFTNDKYTRKEDGSITRLNVMSNDNKKIYVKANKLLSIYKAIYSKHWSALPLIQATPVSTSAEDELGAELAETIFKNEFYNFKRNGTFSTSLMWYIITGNAFCKVKYNEKKGKKTIETTDLIVKEGRVDAYPISPFLVYFDPMASSIRESKYAFETFIIERKTFEKLYPGKKPPGSLANNLKYRILLSGDFANLDRKLNFNDYVELVKFYEKPNDDYENGRYYLMSDQEIVENKNFPFSEEIGIPLAQAKRMDTGSAYGSTAITHSIALDREFALAFGQLTEHAEKFASPILALPLGSKIKGEDIGNRRVKAVYYNGKLGAPAFIQPTEFAQYFYQSMAKIEEELADNNAVHAPSMAKRPEGVRSGLQQAYMKDTDDSTHIPEISNFFKMFEDIGHIYLEFIAEHYTEERYLTVTGKDNVKYVKFIGKNLGKNTNIHLDVVAGLPLDRTARQQTLAQLKSAGAIQNNEFLQLLELGELDPIYRMHMKDKMRQNEELDTLKKGKYVKARLEDNHMIHIKMIVQYAKTSAFTELSEDKQRMIWNHVDEHQKLLSATFMTNPIVANFAMNMGYMDEADMQAIQQEIQRSTAERQGDATGVQTDGSSAGSQPSMTPEDAANRMQATGGMSPQVSALKNS